MGTVALLLVVGLLGAMLGTVVGTVALLLVVGLLGAAVGTVVGVGAAAFLPQAAILNTVTAASSSAMIFFISCHSFLICWSKIF